MSHHDHSSMSPGNDEQIPQKTASTEQQDDCTVDTCTMNPCPMKTETKGDQPVKCPACGKTNGPD